MTVDDLVLPDLKILASENNGTPLEVLSYSWKHQMFFSFDVNRM